MVPCHTLFGVMAALLQREVTGRGQTVAVSQLESAIAMKPSDAMAYAANGDFLGPLGFGDDHAAPHGVYKTLGYRQWVAISIFSEDDWRTFKGIMGNPAWADRPAFATLHARKENEDELNGVIEGVDKQPACLPARRTAEGQSHSGRRGQRRPRGRRRPPPDREEILVLSRSSRRGLDPL